MRRFPVLSALALVPVLAAGGGWGRVERRSIERTVPAIGALSAPRRAMLGSQVSGRVTDVLVEVGDRVGEGQEVVRLDLAFFEIECARARAALAAANAQVEAVRSAGGTARAGVAQARVAVAEADLGFERMRVLWEQPEPSIPKSRYDDALFARDRARAALAAAEALVTEAEARLAAAGAAVAEAEQAGANAERRKEEAVIRAPFAGVVTRRLVDPGRTVTSAPATDLLEVAETGTLFLDFPLPQRLLGAVGRGAAFTFTVPGREDEPVRAAVDRVLPDVDPATRTFTCRTRIANADGKLPAGALVSVRVVERTASDVLAVPRAAVRASAGTFAVTGRGGPKTFRAGLATDDWVEVRDGLAEGEEILLAGE